MIRTLIQYFILLVVLSLASSCEKLLMQPDPANTPMNNFQVLWDNLDRKYSFFTYKNVDWDSIYDMYYPLINDELQDTSLFRILGEMLLSLEDIHTDMWSSFDRINYDISDQYPKNFSMSILDKEYLGFYAGLKEGIKFKVIDSIGYLYIGSFTPEITDQGFREIIDELGDVKGYIIDVRNNDGGNSNNGLIIANHFFDSTRLVKINHFKTGPGHNDFSPVKQYISPTESLRINKQTVILANRYCFSAANTFVCWMSMLPHVQVIGDTSGGGGGTPYFSELPNGWQYRFSATQSFRPDGLNLDLGVPPDIVVNQTSRDTRHNEDSLLKYALKLLNIQEN